MKIVFSAISARQIKRLPRSEQVKVLRKINRLAANPFIGKPLKGKFAKLYSLKAWPYRIIYRPNPGREIFINIVQHRQGVYKM